MFLKVLLFFDPKASKHPSIFFPFRVNHNVLMHFSKVDGSWRLHIAFISNGEQMKATKSKWKKAKGKLLDVSKWPP